MSATEPNMSLSGDISPACVAVDDDGLGGVLGTHCVGGGTSVVAGVNVAARATGRRACATSSGGVTGAGPSMHLSKSSIKSEIGGGPHEINVDADTSRQMWGTQVSPRFNACTQALMLPSADTHHSQGW